MNVLFRCEYKITPKHIRESRRFTLLKMKHFDYVVYAMLGVVALIIIIRSFQIRSFFALVGMVLMYRVLFRYFFRFRDMAHAIPQQEVYAGEKFVSQGTVTVTDSGITFYNNDLTSEFIGFDMITHLGISVDVMTLYIKGKKNKIIPQYLLMCDKEVKEV